MIFTHLARHWLARRHYPLPSLLACILRSLRVVLFYRAHLRLLTLDIYRQYLTQVHDDVFHHLSHRHYLARGLSLRQRVRCVITHYLFEDMVFDSDYKQAVYRHGGLPLWRHEAGGHSFAITLAMASRLNAEGDLTLTATADGVCLHRLSFSWVDLGFADPAGADARMLHALLPSMTLSIVPFVARNQGHRADAAQAFAAFEEAFPNNSPSFFCFAALQGMAQALDMDQVAAVGSAWQSAYDPADKHFVNAYDGFWQTLGGVPTAGRCWRIALPLNLKPLAEMPSKHRKRAMMRRENWRAIGDASGAVLRRHLLRARARTPLAAPAGSAMLS